jgi:hypothetical protein
MAQEVHISSSDSPSIDAFGRYRMSSPHTIFDSKQVNDNQPLFWDESLESGSGISSSYSADKSMTTITSTEDTAGKFTRQTFMRFDYQPGKGQLILLTGILAPDDGGTGVVRRIGQFDDDNGVFFEDDEGTINLVIRSKVTGAVVDTKVSQSSWNKDKLNGTGGSKYNLYFNKAQIFFIDYEWLGVGRVRCGFVHDGTFIVCHEFLHSNRLSTPYMTTPNLPVRYQMETTSSSPASQLVVMCSTVISEGGQEKKGALRYASTAGTAVTASSENVIYAIIGVRLKSDRLDNIVEIHSVALQIQTQSENGEWIWILNPTVAGSFTYSDQANSSVQIATGATANTVTNGTSLEGGYIESSSGGGGSGHAKIHLENEIRLGAAIDGTVDEMVLCWRPVGGTSAHEVEGSITWHEL